MKIRWIRKVLLPVTAAFLLTEITGPAVVVSAQEDGPQTVSVMETSRNTAEGETTETGLTDAEFCISKGYDVEELPGGLIQLKGDSDEFIAGTVKEIGDRLGPPATYSDVIRTITDNAGIKEEYRKILIEGLKNLEKNGLDMDLRILNYNMKRLTVQELSRSEIQKLTGYENTVAFYKMQDGTAIISNDTDPAVAAKKQISILHEILGHGMTETTLKDKSMRISKLFIAEVSGEGSRKTITPNMVGMSISEGIADTITYYALGGDYDVTYDAEVFQLEFIRNLLDLDLSDVIDNGTAGIIRAMAKAGFATPQTYIANMDAETMATHSNTKRYDGVTVSQNVAALVSEYAEIQLEDDAAADEIKEAVENAFEKSSFEEVVVNADLRMDVCDVSKLKEQALSSVEAFAAKEEEPGEKVEENGFAFQVYSDHARVTGYHVENDELVIPDKVRGVPVTEMEPVTNDNIGMNKYYLTAVTLPETMKKIPDRAFADCNMLASVNLPKNLKKIGELAFYHCGIESLEIPVNVTKVGMSAFAGCWNLKSVVLPDNMTEIPDGLFAGCSELVSVKLPSGLEKIGSSCFYSCGKLADIKLPDSVREIGSEAFTDCEEITGFDLSNVEILGAFSTFSGCTGLTEIDLASLKEFDYGEKDLHSSCGTFWGCTAVTKVDTGDHVTEIPKAAFRKCSSLKDLRIGDSVKTIQEEAFYVCEALESAVIPDVVRNISDTAFSDCPNLTLIGGDVVKEYVEHYNETHQHYYDSQLKYAAG